MQKRIALPGSTRRLLAGAKVVGKPDVNQRIEITIQIRRRPGFNLKKKLAELSSPGDSSASFAPGPCDQNFSCKKDPRQERQPCSDILGTS